MGLLQSLLQEQPLFSKETPTAAVVPTQYSGYHFDTTAPLGGRQRDWAVSLVQLFSISQWDLLKSQASPRMTH